MSIPHPFKHYAIQYQESLGLIHEDNVYASNAMEAQNLAMELNEKLNRRPHRITAILQVPDSSL